MYFSSASVEPSSRAVQVLVRCRVVLYMYGTALTQFAGQSRSV